MADMMNKIIKNKQINFNKIPNKSHSRVVIAVGTPITKNGIPNLESLKKFAK